ncbi:MAG: hypothetical protein N3C12_06325 [Candidatus Binatia bacterium]|nr:hypothetical protein [Candidatus Binatia bacterium]
MTRAERSPVERAWGAVAAVACAFVFLAIWRERNAEFGPRRVWGELSPLFEACAEWGNALTSAVLQEPRRLFLVSAVLGALVGILSLFWSWRRGLVGLVWIAAALATIGAQWAILGNELRLGKVVYLCALGAAVLVGWWLQRFPEVSPEPIRSTDFVLALWLLIVAVFLRLWALDELPRRFEGEMGLSMLAGSSWYSLKNYLVSAVTTASIGCAHLFAQWAAFVAWGDSVFSLRASGVVLGVALVWNLFWLLRNYVGRDAAWCGTLLALCGAEQLWWSRSENTYFIAVCFAGVVTARLAAWLVTEPCWQRAVVVALWMGATRLFYLAAVTLVLVPPAVVLHQLIFNRPRRLRYLGALFVLTAGVGLWWSSLSLLHLVSQGEWRFIHPALHGELTGAGAASLGERLIAVATRVANNAAVVAAQWTVSSGFSQWYERQTWPYPPTVINVGIVGVGILGLGTALGQLRRGGSAVLVAWFVSGCLPALLSTDPADRRMAAAFPALYALAGYGWQQVMFWIRGCGSSFVTWSWRLPALAALAAIALSSAASHLALPKAEVSLAKLGRATRDVFRTSEAIYYEMDPAALPLVVMVHSSLWRERLPCIQALSPRLWLSTVIEQPCGFDDAVWTWMVPDEVRRSRRANDHEPRRWTVFLAAVPDAQRKLALLRRLFPQGKEQWVGTLDWSFSLTVFTAERAGLELLQVSESTELPATGEGASHVAGVCTVAMRAALFARDDDWYRLQALPPFELLRWKLGDFSSSPDPGASIPLTSGFHPVELESRGPCGSLPRMSIRGAEETTWRVAPLWSPWLGEDPLTRAPRMAIYDGFRLDRRIGEEEGNFVDLGLDPLTGLVALTWRDGRYWFLELDERGRLGASYSLDLPGGTIVRGFVPGPSGHRLLHAESGMFVIDRLGRVVYRWPFQPSPIRPQAVWWDEGQSLFAAVPAVAAVVQFDLAGNVLSRIHHFTGGLGRFVEPTGIAYDPQTERFAVAEADGRILLLRMRENRPHDLVLDTEVRPPWSVPAGAVRVLAFDHQGRLVVGDPEKPWLFVYDREGRRLLAREPAADWRALLEPVGVPARVVPFDGALLVVAGGPGVLRFEEHLKVVASEAVGSH